MARRGQWVLPLLAVILVIVAIVTGKEPTSRLTRRVDSDVTRLRIALNNIFDNDDFCKQPANIPQEGRTFGHKRIQFMMMPMIYKMGVMMTMIAVLTVISLKGLLIGVALLVLKLSTIFGKFFAGWHEHSSGSWNLQHQPIHVHLHSTGPYNTHGQAYGGWETAGGNPHETYYYKG